MTLTLEREQAEQGRTSAAPTVERRHKASIELGLEEVAEDNSTCKARVSD